MRWIRQDPITEDTCGQCAVAMLLGISKREAVARVGHDEGTDTPELASVLRGGGLLVGSRLRRVRDLERIATPRALLLGFWKRHPHWMVWNDGRVFDPVEGIIAARTRGLPPVLRVTHYLWVDDASDAISRQARGRSSVSASSNPRLTQSSRRNDSLMGY